MIEGEPGGGLTLESVWGRKGDGPAGEGRAVEERGDAALGELPPQPPRCGKRLRRNFPVDKRYRMAGRVADP
jgi:hypothetical protein